MQKIKAHSKTSLFLMEMIFSILFLALSCTACIQVFAAAGKESQKAREYNHIQELTICAGEALECWDGNTDSFPSLFPEKKLKDNQIVYFFDRKWNSCQEKDKYYILSILPEVSQSEKTAEINFYDISGKSLYSQTLKFPFCKKEEVS